MYQVTYIWLFHKGSIPLVGSLLNYLNFIIMVQEELLFRNIENAMFLYGEATGQHQGQGEVNFSRVFGKLLEKRLRGITPESHPDSDYGTKSCKTIRNKEGLYITYIHQMLRGVYANPCPESPVDVYVHWGMNSAFLSDLTSWNSRYVIKNVPLEYMTEFCESEISNCADLVQALKTGDFSIVEEY